MHQAAHTSSPVSAVRHSLWGHTAAFGGPAWPDSLTVGMPAQGLCACRGGRDAGLSRPHKPGSQAAAPFQAGLGVWTSIWVLGRLSPEPSSFASPGVGVGARHHLTSGGGAWFLQDLGWGGLCGLLYPTPSGSIKASWASGGVWELSVSAQPEPSELTAGREGTPLWTSGLGAQETEVNRPPVSPGSFIGRSSASAYSPLMGMFPCKREFCIFS